MLRVRRGACPRGSAAATESVGLFNSAGLFPVLSPAGNSWQELSSRAKLGEGFSSW